MGLEWHGGLRWPLAGDRWYLVISEGLSRAVELIEYQS